MMLMYNITFQKTDIQIIQTFLILSRYPLSITDRVYIFELLNDHLHHIGETFNFAAYLTEIVYSD